jgi:hypothetical protein
MVAAIDGFHNNRIWRELKQRFAMARSIDIGKERYTRAKHSVTQTQTLSFI